MNYQIELKEILRRNRFEDSPNKKKWKMAVLKDSYITNEYVKSTITSSRLSRGRIEKSLDATRDVINTYNDFNNDYGDAIKRLPGRIEDDERKTAHDTTEIEVLKVLPMELLKFPKPPISKLSTGNVGKTFKSNKKRIFIPHTTWNPNKYV